MNTKQIHVRLDPKRDALVIAAIDEQVAIGVPVNRAAINLMHRGVSPESRIPPVTGPEVRAIINAALASAQLVRGEHPQTKAPVSSVADRLRKAGASMIYEGENE